MSVVEAYDRDLSPEWGIWGVSGAIDRERYRATRRACVLFLDDLRCDSELREERKRRVRSKLRFTFDQFAQISSNAVPELTRRARYHWSIAGPTAKPNQRVGSISRRVPLIFATESILAQQTRKWSTYR